MRTAVAIAIILLWGAAQGCVCHRPSDRLLGRVEAPVGVELIEQKVTAPNPFGPPGGGVLGTLTTHVLKIKSTPPIETPVRCNPAKVDVSVATSLDRIAYRCQAGADWIFVWVASNQQFTSEPANLGAKAPAPGAGGWIDANALPTLLDAAPEMLAHGTGYPRETLLEIERVGGEEALTGALVAAVKMPPSDDARGTPIKDAWLERRSALSSAKQGRVDAALRRAVESPRPGAGALLRAVRVLDAADSALPDILSARLRELDADNARMPQANALSPNQGWDLRMWLEILHRLIKQRPAVAGEIGCSDLGRSPVLRTESLVAVAKGASKCEAVSRLLERRFSDDACSVNLSCSGFTNDLRLCTPREIDTKLSAFAIAPFDPYGQGLTSDIGLLAAGRALGVVPAEIALRLDRALYSIDMPATPNCPDARAGDSCRCDELASRPLRALCKVPPATKDGDAPGCRFRIDDGKKQVTNVRRCLEVGQECRSDADCCASAACGQGKRCEAKLKGK